MQDNLVVAPYTPDKAPAWNEFVNRSRNGTFLIDRRFMDYHADRFTDASITVERNGKLVAILPANREGDKLISHGGLTYGGLIAGKDMRAGMMVDIVEALLQYLRSVGVTEFVYKPTPHFYHSVPLEEDIYAMTKFGARLIQTDASAAIPLKQRPKESQSRRQGAKLAIKEGTIVEESKDWPAFWSILDSVLAERHDATPTHSLNEIQQLSQAFPSRIRLFGAMLAGRMIGGVVTFDCGRCIHVQYIAGSREARDVGALDAIMLHLITDEFADRDWFDFGISTTDAGAKLNSGLMQQKEMFGARCVVYQRYSIKV